jgi:uncharacterized Tic20 family protein
MSTLILFLVIIGGLYVLGNILGLLIAWWIDRHAPLATEDEYGGFQIIEETEIIRKDAYYE